MIVGVGLVSFFLGALLTIMIFKESHKHEWEFNKSILLRNGTGGIIGEADIYKCKTCGEYKRVIKYGQNYMFE